MGYYYPPSDHPASAQVRTEDIQIENGAHGPVTFTSNYVLETEDGYYVFKLERRAKDVYTGRVMLTQDTDDDSPIIMDVISARGGYTDQEKTTYSVNHHHFRIISPRITFGSYRPYHFIPGSPEIADVIRTIEVGDRLKITGFDVNTFRIDANNPNGFALGMDKGCRTMIVTAIEIS